MDDSCVVSLGQPFGNLHGDRNNLADGENSRNKQFAQRLPFDELEYQKVYTVLVPDVVEGANIGMRETGDGTRLLLQALAKIGFL